MNKYKVEFIQKETFVVDVLAKDEAEARKKADIKWEELVESRTTHYYSYSGEPQVEVGTIYDVTNTDDPFDAGWDNTCETEGCGEATDTTVNEVRYCSKHLLERDLAQN